jgi:hypothetical protein
MGPLSPIQKEYIFYYDEIRWWSTVKMAMDIFKTLEKFKNSSKFQKQQKELKTK